MHQFKLYFDGGCKPNPGQGYGSFEIVSEHQPYSHRSTFIQFGFMTNNMAEYHAMLHGIKKLWHDSKNGNVLCVTPAEQVRPSRITLSIYSDSKLLVEQMNGRWKIKVGHIRELESEARLILKEFGHWKLSWRGRATNVARFGH